MSENLHEIRLCKISEKEKLKSFIDLHWKKGHILAHCDTLLDFQHLDEKRGVYNFIVAFNKESKEFDAILGFIPTSQFDEGLKDNRDFWGAIWKSNYPGLGRKLLETLLIDFKANSFSFINITQAAQITLKKNLNFDNKKIQLDTMRHFYIKNSLKSSYELAVFKPFKNIKFDRQSPKFEELNKDEFINLNLPYSDKLPIKSKEFYIKRYFENPFYDYKFFLLKLKESFIIIVTQFRYLRQGGGHCMRIVDFIGKFEKNLYHSFNELIQRFDCEYIDFLCFTQQDKEILDMGFCLKDDEKEIIPHFFEPFVKENIKVVVAYYAKDKYQIYNGDADSNRLNLLIERKK